MALVAKRNALQSIRRSPVDRRIPTNSGYCWSIPRHGVLGCGMVNIMQDSPSDPVMMFTNLTSKMDCLPIKVLRVKIAHPCARNLQQQGGRL